MFAANQMTSLGTNHTRHLEGQSLANEGIGNGRSRLSSLVAKALSTCLDSALKSGGRITSAVTLLALLGIGDATGVPVLEGTTRSASAEPGKEDLEQAIEELNKQFKNQDIKNFWNIDKPYEKLIKEGSPEALKAILEVISQPYEFKHYLLAVNNYHFQKSFSGAEFEDIFKQAFVGEDALLVAEEFSSFAFEIFKSWAKDNRAEKVRELLPDLRKHPQPYHFSAALRALGHVDKIDCVKNVQTVKEVLLNLPENVATRNAYITAAAYCIEESCRTNKDSTPFKEVMIALAQIMDEPSTTRATRLTLGRTFARMFSHNDVYTNAQPWLDVIEGQDIREKLKREGYAVTEPERTFLGQKITGDRIVFAIDVSGSMEEPIDIEGIVERIQKKAVVTGQATTEPSKEEVLKQLTGLDNLKLSRLKRTLKTKWDFVRLCLISSLNQLSEDQSFEVILFAGDYRNLERDRELSFKKATRGNVRNVVSKLNRYNTFEAGTDFYSPMDAAFRGTFGRGSKAGSKIEHLINNAADTIVIFTDAFMDQSRSPMSHIIDGGHRKQTDLTTHSGREASIGAHNRFRDVEMIAVGILGSIFLEPDKIAILKDNEFILKTITQFPRGRSEVYL
ncbi:MAG: hypothetical protein R3A13_03020 [Bdellovibrionota bacterium]